MRHPSLKPVIHRHGIQVSLSYEDKLAIARLYVTYLNKYGRETYVEFSEHIRARTLKVNYTIPL
jgi:hypothetical protein